VIITKKVKEGGFVVKQSKVKPGQDYGMLTVFRRDAANPNRKPFWMCKCKCGNETSVRADYLTSGKIISCGCYRESKFLLSQENIQQCKQLFKEYKSVYGEDSRIVEKVAQVMRVSPSNVQKFLSVSGIEVDFSKEELAKYTGV
jgi:hypothetical protein